MHSAFPILPISTPICKSPPRYPPLLPDIYPGNHKCHPTDLITVVKAYVALLTFPYLGKATDITTVRWTRTGTLGGTLFIRKYIHQRYANIDTSTFNILIPDKIPLHDLITITKAQRIHHTSYKLSTYTTVAISNITGFHHIIFREGK